MFGDVLLCWAAAMRVLGVETQCHLQTGTAEDRRYYGVISFGGGSDGEVLCVCTEERGAGLASEQGAARLSL